MFTDHKNQVYQNDPNIDISEQFVSILLTILSVVSFLCLELGQPFGQAHSSERVRLGFGTNSLPRVWADAEGLDDEAAGEERTEGKRTNGTFNIDIKERDGDGCENDADFLHLTHLIRAECA